MCGLNNKQQCLVTKYRITVLNMYEMNHLRPFGVLDARNTRGCDTRTKIHSVSSVLVFRMKLHPPLGCFLSIAQVENRDIHSWLLQYLLSQHSTGNMASGPGHWCSLRNLMPGFVAFVQRSVTPATAARSKDWVPGWAATVAPVGGVTAAPAPIPAPAPAPTPADTVD